MSSRASALHRAALGSPGAALAPLDSEARADYLQDRIGLFAKLFLALGSFFLVAGSLYRLVFFHEGPLATFRLDTPAAKKRPPTWRPNRSIRRTRSTLGHELPADLEALILRCLDKLPENSRERCGAASGAARLRRAGLEYGRR